MKREYDILPVPKPRKPHPRGLTEEQKALIREVYKSGIMRGDGKLAELSKKIGKTIPFISRYAGTCGLTSYSRQSTDQHKQSISTCRKKVIAEHGHPRGALGLKHTQTTKEAIGIKSKEAAARMSAEQKSDIKLKMLKTKYERGNMINPRGKTTWKQSWQEIGGQRFYARSSWEVQYAHILEKRKSLGIIKSWEHEPDTFWFEKIKTGTRCYIPDFKIVWADGSIEYHEIKGWMDDRSKTKIKRMRIYHPHIKLIVIDAKAYKAIIRQGI